MSCVRPFGQKNFGIIQKYEFDLKISRTRTFVRGQRRTKVRPCGHTFTQNMRSWRHPFLVRFLDTGLPLPYLYS